MNEVDTTSFDITKFDNMCRNQSYVETKLRTKLDVTRFNMSENQAYVVSNVTKGDSVGAKASSANSKKIAILMLITSVAIPLVVVVVVGSLCGYVALFQIGKTITSTDIVGNKQIDELL